MMPTARDNLNLVNLRLPRAMVERVDELQGLVSDAPELRTLPSVTRSDVLRLIVLRGLRPSKRSMKRSWTRGSSR